VRLRLLIKKGVFKPPTAVVKKTAYFKEDYDGTTMPIKKLIFPF